MNKKAHKIALVTHQNHTTALSNEEDQNLLYFLRSRGLDMHYEIWDNPDVDWPSYDAVILKSTWDYHEKYDRFTQWLDQLEKTGARLFNPIQTVRWNSDKRYLKEVMADGFPVAPSLFFEPGERPDISGLFAQLGTGKLIAKPCVSAGARGTFIINKSEAGEQQPRIHSFMDEKNYIIQPFIEEIKQGEWSLFFFNGKYSHCVLKVPKTDDFRVQPQHGGVISSQQASADMIARADQYVQRYARGTLYCRVDVVRYSGKLTLMELEMIEPYLFLDTAAGAMENYYSALVDMI